ncbi:sulfate ABC transporter permease subunit CysT [Sphingomonas sp. ASY06-1R]|uniref:sulfate ABC transporter permease subunit CysT n=1 Tax=Sphingomonas sp. ASY06-1R TaxID=3445771 RepID=UPI003FA23BAF
MATASLQQPPKGHGTRTKSPLPGLSLTLGITLTWLTILLLLPLVALFAKSIALGPAHFVDAAFSTRALASYRLSFGAAFVAAAVNAVFGLLVAWVLVRYRFPGRRLLSALVDLPFALPTAVAGIALTAVYANNGWVGQPASVFGLTLAYNPVGVVIALTFISLPFVVRTIEPVLADLGKGIEEAAATLGAGRWTIFRRVILPEIMPSLITGFSLAFARGVGEYGSVIFIAGNMPFKSEIAPLLIVTKLEEYDYAGATAIATVLLLASLVLLLAINAYQGRELRRRSA